MTALGCSFENLSEEYLGDCAAHGCSLEDLTEEYLGDCVARVVPLRT